MVSIRTVFRCREIAHDSDSCCVGFVGTLRPWHGMSILGLALFRSSSRNTHRRGC